MKKQKWYIPGSVKVMLLLILLVCIISATLPVQNKFKNLKILPKDISEEALDKIMDDFQKSLGVDCNYCHAKKTGLQELEFENDAKPEKEIARKMMTMTNYINKNFFDFNNIPNSIQAVTCFTCHRGSPRPGPETFPMPQ